MDSGIGIEIRNLTKTVGTKTIVDGLSFDIPKGEVFGLLGPNGAGKTTTIRMMVGLISISRGHVRVNGVDVTKNFKGAMQHVGVIVENPEMYKYLSGLQNLKHFARMSKGVGRERIQEVVKQVGLTDRIHDKVKTYSLGMRQRLGLAQALLRNPDVIILDEPTNGLDPAGIRELRDYLRGLASEQGISVIVSSHLLSEMELMCDRVAIIQSGKLVDVRSIRDTNTDAAQEQTVVMEVDDGKRAEQALRSSPYRTSQLTIKAVTSTTIEISLIRDGIPDIVHLLDSNGIRIYGVRPLNKTLEETFLEITGGAINV